MNITYKINHIADTLLEMQAITIPCGCKLTWSEYETVLVLCESHDLQYEQWKGSSEEFITMVTTPKSIYRVEPLEALQ